MFFLRSEGRATSRDLYRYDLTSGNEQVFLSAQTLLSGGSEAVSPEERARRERMRLTGGGITDFRLSRDGATLLIPYSGRLFLVNTSDASFREIPTRASGTPIDAQLSPDGRKIACVRNGDVYVTTIATDVEVRVTTRRNEHISYGEAEFVAQEEMGRFSGMWWSPDSRSLLIEEADSTPVETLHISDPMHPEAAPAEYSYPRAGRDNVRVRLLLATATSNARLVPVDWDHEAFPYLASVVWNEHHDAMVLVQNRRQTEERLLAIDARNGQTRVLITETDAAWVNIDEQMPRVLDNGHFLWTTERRGAWQLEVHNADGALERVLTLPELGYQGFAGVNESANVVYVQASTDPTQMQLFRLPLNGEGEPTRLSHGDGSHIGIFDEALAHYVDVADLVEGSTRARVYDADGTERGEVRSVAEVPDYLPNLEFVEVDEELRMRAVLVRPRNFDAQLRYPVLVAVYGGPGYVNVRRTPQRYLDEQWMADHGYIVVSIDGHGTPNRGRDWERAIARDVITVPLADQVRGLRALGERFHEMDLAHVGIYGWSFGGYFSAMAAMREPTVFHAAVAGAPVTDWRDYDTHYTERFMGLPSENEEGYRSSSCITWAEQLTRPLLLIHGTADDNVYFLHSVRLADALLRAGRPFEFLPLSGFTHMVPEPTVSLHLNERISGFFGQHLTH